MITIIATECIELCMLTSKMAKLVRWLHSHTTDVLVSSATWQFNKDQSPNPS